MGLEADADTTGAMPNGHRERLQGNLRGRNLAQQAKKSYVCLFGNQNYSGHCLCALGRKLFGYFQSNND
jgi:hypothetical protein